MKANLEQVSRTNELHFVKGNICSFRTIEKVVRRVDAVVHLAAVVSPYLSVHKPDFTNQVNVAGTLNVLRATVRHKLSRIVFASSSSVYGETGSRVHVPENASTNPITPYGASKLAGEKYCRAFCYTYGISAVSLRYFNVYGPRQRYNPYSGVIAIFANRAARDQRGAIYGDGEQTRDFINVKDVAKANLCALAYRGGTGESFNIGTGIATTINELYRMIVNLADKSNLKPIRKPPRIGDIRHSCANVDLAQNALRFKAEVPLHTGLSFLFNHKR